ncbi:MAG TPA: hypothetical protein VN851_25325 [Thermoanaerobaculia bacterium]|nr:hypothetical protein [Thermoanaerobaculia bacterium]
MESRNVETRRAQDRKHSLGIRRIYFRRFIVSYGRRLLFAAGFITILSLPLILWRYFVVGGLGEAIPIDITGEPLQELWFTPSGELAYVAMSGSMLRLTMYDPMRKRREVRFLDFYRKEGRGMKLSSNIPLPERSRGYSDGIGTDSSDQVIYAVSDDARSIAWARNRLLKVQAVDRFSASDLQSIIELDDEVYSITLTNGAGMVSILSAQGTFFTYISGQKMKWNLTLPRGRWRLNSRGPSIVATDIENAAAGLIVLAHSPFLTSEAAESPLSFVKSGFGSGSDLSLVTSVNGDSLFVGTESGLIAQQGGAPTILPLTAGEKLRAISQFREKQLIAAGDFRGIYLVSRPGKATLIADTLPGINLLAARGNFVAYATDHEVVLMSRDFLSVKTTAEGGLLTGLVGLILAALGHFHNLGQRHEDKTKIDEEEDLVGRGRESFEGTNGDVQDAADLNWTRYSTSTKGGVGTVLVILVVLGYLFLPPSRRSRV